MKPADVRFHHIRDYPWRTKWCKECNRRVPWFHEHFKQKKGNDDD